MGINEKIDQIAGIFTRHEVPFHTAPDGSNHRVLVGSTAVFVSVHNWGDGTVVHLDAPVVVDFDLDQHAGTAFIAANRLNKELYFAKFVVHPDEEQRGTISVEYDLLGDDLQGSELMNGLSLIADLADSNDDRLQADIGGKTYAEVVAAAENEPLET